MGTDVKDYYKVLGLTKGVSQEEIKKVYRKLALLYHPDRVQEPGKKQAEEKFKEIAAAYYVLGDVKRRKEYDDYKQGDYSFRSGPGAGDFASQSGFDFNDLMKHFRNAEAESTKQKDNFSRYFFFDDLGDVFSGLYSEQGSKDSFYNEPQFVENDFHQKVNTDLKADLEIPNSVALKGGQIKFRLSDGRNITLKINPNTKNGQRLRLKGLGRTCPCCDHKGDLIIKLRVSNN